MPDLPPVSDVRLGVIQLVGDIRADIARGITPETAIDTLFATAPVLFSRDELALMMAVSIVELAQKDA